ncbi:MAG: hypothetical protein R6W82_12145, partial [bacterium]
VIRKAEMLGLPVGTEKRLTNLTFHSLRHSCVAHLIDLDFTRLEIVEFIAWSNPKMFDRYKHLYDGKRQRMADRIG